jgi:hypothetical protein
MPAEHRPSSAQVVLETKDPAQIERVRDEFRRAGFDVGPLVANNFSISGPRERFDGYFEAPLADDASLEAASAKTKPQPYSADRLPATLRPLVREVVTSRLDFGPGNW